MHLETGFGLGVPVDEAWPVLLDLERVAPCMPGLTVESSEDDYLHATMRVKVGPVTASYRTTVAVESLDEKTHTAVLRVRGRETRGPGTVEAGVTAVLAPDGGDGAASAVALMTELEVTGKIAQFGGSVISEVADRLLRQFAERLEAELAATPGAEGAPPAAGAPRPVEEAISRDSRLPSDAPTLDLGRLAGGLIAARLRLVAVVGLLLVAVHLVVRRRR